MNGQNPLASGIAELRMAVRSITRTYRVCIRNQRQVPDDFDSLGFAASKLWNVLRN